jgi:centrosomal protein CEP104
MEKKEEESYPLLKYRLIGASTEDPENPIYALISGLKNNGWCTVRYCTYPQELLIQLCRPCRLRQINLVFHEYKIPSKIDLYNFFPKTFSDFNLDIDDLIFEKIGYIIPDTNISKKFRAREVKQIFLNENVYYLKFVFYQNYSNLKNVFNQVGLISIQCFGVDFTANNINGLYPSLEQPVDYFTKQSLYPEIKKKTQYDDNMLDEVCASKIQELKDALNMSIKVENYDQAKEIHDMIQLVRKIGEKMNEAKETKNKALEIDDYEMCKIAKENIDTMREKVKSINVGDYGLNQEKEKEKEKEEEEQKDEAGTHPEEELLVEKDQNNVEQEDGAVKGSENGDEDASVRETMKVSS